MICMPCLVYSEYMYLCSLVGASYRAFQFGFQAHNSQSEIWCLEVERSPQGFWNPFLGDAGCCWEESGDRALIFQI